MKPVMTYSGTSTERDLEIDARAYAEAMLNILADFSEEKTHLHDTQRAILNILDDANDEAAQLRTTQRAMINILEDVDAETNERKKSEQQVRELNRSLEARVVQRTAALTAAIKDLEGFSYSVSHDLRAPLRAIDGFSRILLEDYAVKLDDEGRRLMNVVRDNTAKMARLIDDILAFTRAGRSELALVDNDMAALVRTCWEELKPAMGGRQVRYEMGTLPPVRADRAALRQVLINLLSNAVKFTRPRQQAMIEIGGRSEGGENIYYVKDNGAGFDMQYAHKLFSVFQRLHGQDEFEGTGIGLAIVKRIIDKHGGRVWAEGRINEGAIFYFALPNASLDEGEQP